MPWHEHTGEGSEKEVPYFPGLPTKRTPIKGKVNFQWTFTNIVQFRSLSADSVFFPVCIEEKCGFKLTENYAGAMLSHQKQTKFYLFLYFVICCN